MMLTLQNFYERLILLVGAIIILPIGIALGLPFLVLALPLGLVWYIFNVLFTEYIGILESGA